LRDITKEIIEVANGYHFNKPPQVVEDLLEKLGRVLRIIAEWLRELASPHGAPLDSRGVSGLLQILIYVAAVGAMIGLIYLVWRKASTADGAKAKTTKGASAVEEILDAEGWFRQAEKLAASADYKGACRAVYLSLLQQLHENKIAVFAPAKTNFEYSYTLAKYPSIQTPFKQLAERVEVIWFGNREATTEDFDLSKQQLLGMDDEIKRIGAIKAEQQVTKL